MTRQPPKANQAVEAWAVLDERGVKCVDVYEYGPMWIAQHYPGCTQVRLTPSPADADRVAELELEVKRLRKALSEVRHVLVIDGYSPAGYLIQTCDAALTPAKKGRVKK